MMMMTTTTTVAATPTTSSFVVDTLPTTYELQQQSTYNSTQHPFIQSISAETLQIGTWKRVTLNPHDLQCQYDKGNKLFSWCIQDGLSKFKMEFPESSLKSIQLMPLQTRAGWARLEMFILSAEHISFYMKSLHQHGWVQCRDYTEDKQASTVLLHQLDGPALALKAELDILLKENPYLASILFK
ncbi:uncharacterized protein BX663DRAFT_511207 [Cokeromyces recurvatus]|uniref:uncharacterized protein n=1 Tax=Cokeromyces recurvatus TaxID=90255 RepID=UPI002220A8E6|nr:uncharacterized protein BX663DRAFT_511207 [Cokeromyces recurvatus]KAI7902483.1 hypothetical protein BX663DRAFT_511207 [Cokeromyces recurvatus]